MGLSSETIADSPHTDYTNHSVTISTSSLPLSAFSGPFVLTLHSSDGEPAIYDFDRGRFPRKSTVRFNIAIPVGLSISAVSIQARYLLGWTKWRISSVRLLQHDTPPFELVSGPYTVPGLDETPSRIPLTSFPRDPLPSAGGSAILHIWLPRWNLALRHPSPVHRNRDSTISTASSNATLVPSDRDLRGWTITPSLKLPPTQSIGLPSADHSPPPSTPLAPLIATSPRYASWGHASLSIFPSSIPPSSQHSNPAIYISVWPSELSPSLRLPKSFHLMRKLHCKATWSPSLASDILEEDGRVPDVELHILGVDVERLQEWADRERKRQRGYTPWSWNCAEVVWKAICVGLVRTPDERESGRGDRKPLLPRRGRAMSITKVKAWEKEPFIRDLTHRRPDKTAEGFPGRIAEWTGTKVPADLEVIVERMKVDGYGC